MKFLKKCLSQLSVNSRRIGNNGLLSFSAAFVCLSIVGCSDSDDVNSGDVNSGDVNNVFSGKKIVSIQYISDYGADKDIYTYTYDSWNRLVRVDDHRYGLYAQFVYDKSNLKIYYHEEGEMSMLAATAVLGKSGCIEQMYLFDYHDDEPYQEWKFSYDSSNHLTKVVIFDFEYDNEEVEYNLTWENDNIVKTSSYGYGDYSMQFKPGKVESKGLLLYDTVYGLDFDDVEHLAMGGLLGKAPKYLPSAYDYDNDDWEEFNWITNEEGYPCILNNTYRYIWK